MTSTTETLVNTERQRSGLVAAQQQLEDLLMLQLPPDACRHLQDAVRVLERRISLYDESLAYLREQLAAPSPRPAPRRSRPARSTLFDPLGLTHAPRRR